MRPEEVERFRAEVRKVAVWEAAFVADEMAADLQERHYEHPMAHVPVEQVIAGYKMIAKLIRRLQGD